MQSCAWYEHGSVPSFKYNCVLLLQSVALVTIVYTGQLLLVRILNSEVIPANHNKDRDKLPPQKIERDVAIL